MLQSKAILKMLAMDLGYAPKDSTILYEVEWMYAMLEEVMDKTSKRADTLLKNSPSEED